MTGTALRERASDPVVWHDVECAGYGEDLPLWRELAADCAGPVLELGCGTGRVALDLARQGLDVTGLDSDRALVAELRRRARAEGATVEAVEGDARSFSLDRRFALITAPMQVVQLLDGAAARAELLAAAARHLNRAGLLAIAVADPLEGVPPGPVSPPLPDVSERDGWVFSSTPTAVSRERNDVVVERVREVVSPDGAHTRREATIRLRRLEAAALAREGEAAGYHVRRARHVPATRDYVGTTVVVLEAPS